MAGTSTSSFELEVIAGPTAVGTKQDFEVGFARRALAMLKARLGSAGLVDLLREDIATGNDFMRECVKRSHGEWKPATVQLRARGITSGQFGGWFHHALSDEAAMLAAQPEHYVMIANGDGSTSIVENLGPYICSSVIHFTAEDQAVGELLPDYPVRLVGYGQMDDGTVTGHVLHQFRDTEDGLAAHLTIFFPAACPEELFEQHRQHLVVEFGNWITAAAAAQSAH